VNLAGLAWLDELTPKLERGFALAIDYGFSVRNTTGRPRGRHADGYTAHRRVSDLLDQPARST
jgi:SAM-dependent MidA family methyltransferase